jgi:hypothetical protein
VSWLSLAIGGFLFGFGMTLASGCGSKSLIRVGGGNLKSLIVLVFFAISAYMTLKGCSRCGARWRSIRCASMSRRSARRPRTCRRSSRARRGERDQAVVSVRVRGGDRGLGPRRSRLPRDA